MKNLSKSILIMKSVAMLACGQAPTVAVSEVAPELRDSFYELQEGLNAELGYPAITRNSGGYQLVVDTERAQKTSGNALAATIYTEGTIAVCHWIPGSGEAKLVLAHELLHAMGLPHATVGIMRAKVNYACLDREISCMVEALDFYTHHQYQEQ